MNRMERWVFCWLVLLSVSLSTICENPERGSGEDQKDENQSLSPDQNEGLEQEPNETSVHEGRQESNNEGNQNSEEEVNERSGQDQRRGSGRDGSESDPNQHAEENHRRGKHQSSGQEENQVSGPEAKQTLTQRCDINQSTDGDVNLGRHLSNSCARGKKRDAGFSDARQCVEEANSILGNGNRSQTIEAIENLQQVLEEIEVNESMSMSFNNMVVYLHKHKGPFTGLEIYANENEVTSNRTVLNSKVNIHLPSEINVGANNTIVFSMLTWASENKTTDELYENRLVGLSVRGMNISGLRERVKITMILTSSFNSTQKPHCVFLDFSTRNYSETGCTTDWERDQITCSCNHLTFFGVLLVSPGPSDLTEEHLEILSYITLIGCSLSLFVLIITVFLFITNRKVRSDVAMKVHINLAIALIILNGHFLPSQAVAAMSYPGLCLYIAIALHFSLLSTFSWMALEGFHLYLLLVRVFNIYVRKYLLKLSVVGWGVPAVIVSVVVAIDRDFYGVHFLGSSNTTGTEVCYIVNNTVKIVTTVGVFSLVFLFNVIMLGVTIRRVVKLRKSRQSGQINHETVKGHICTLLGITALLGIPWGLIFFSFGYLTFVGLYAFCILNSLQGFFIFLWFLMSLRKLGQPPAATSSETQSTNS